MSAWSAMKTDTLDVGVSSQSPDNLAEGETVLGPPQPAFGYSPLLGDAALGLAREHHEFLLEFLTGVFHGPSHLHRGSLGTHAGKREIDIGIRLANLDLALRNFQHPRSNHAHEVVRSLTYLRGIVPDL